MRNKILSFFILFIILFESCIVSKSGKKSQDTLAGDEKYNNSALFADAVKERLIGNYIQASMIFEQCLKKDPKNAAAMYELARIYTLQKNYPRALELSKKAVEINPDNDWYLITLADVYQKSRMYNESSEIYEKIIKKHPDNLEYYDEAAINYIYANKLEEAVKIYDKIENIIGVTEDISIQKEKIYLNLKKDKKAIEEIEKLIAAYPKETKYQFLLIDLSIATGQKDKAFETLKNVAKVDSTNPLIHLSLADYYKLKGDYKTSYNELKIAFNSPNLDIDTKMKILLSYYSLSEKNEDMKNQAYELLDILLKVHPNDAKAFTIYGDFLYRDKKYKQAKDQYIKVLALDSSKYFVWEQILIVNSDLEDYESLKTMSKTAIELFPEQPLPFFFNGLANYQLKDYQSAINSFKTGVDLVVDNKLLKSQFYSNLGDAYYQIEKYTETFDSYEKALELDDKNAYVMNNYSYYLTLKNMNLEKALSLAQKANELTPTNSSFMDTYAWAFYKLGKFSDSKIWIEKAIDNGGSQSSTILEHYGDILYKLGDSEKAMEYWKKAKTKGDGSNQLEKKINDGKLYE